MPRMLSSVLLHLDFSRSGTFAFQTHDLWQWVFVAVAIAVPVAGVAVLRARGSRTGQGWRGLISQVLDGTHSLAKIDAWAGLAIGVASWSLVVGLPGFVWDVAWHADNGRDTELFTVPHTLIVLGLFGIFMSGVLAVVVASLEHVPAVWGRGRLKVPASGAALLLLGLGALIGFPLDDFWHADYGIDVTMWSPTHLLMIGGASLTPVALWLMLREAGVQVGPGRWRRVAFVAMAGACLVGLSTFQLEYDMGIPQWQLLFQPILIAAAAAIALVAARAAIGRGGAVLAVAVFLAIRVALLAFIGLGLHHSLPRFPLYLGEAVCVELGFGLAVRRLPPAAAGAACGLLVGTLGLATEWGWIELWYPYAWGASLLPYLWLAVAAGVTGGIVGMALGRVLAGLPAGVPAPAVVGSLLVLGVLIGFHLPLRHAGPGSVTVAAKVIGAEHPARDRDGDLTQAGVADVTVRVSPATAATGADWFSITAWQGHAPVVDRRLVRIGPGLYRSDGPVPFGGDWKSMVFRAQGDTVEAVPLSFPPDHSYDLAAIPLPGRRTMRFEPASALLMREFHGGLSALALSVTLFFGITALIWAAALALAARAIGRTPSPVGVPARHERPRAVRAARRGLR